MWCLLDATIALDPSKFTNLEIACLIAIPSICAFFIGLLKWQHANGMASGAKKEARISQLEDEVKADNEAMLAQSERLVTLLMEVKGSLAEFNKNVDRLIQARL